MSSLQKRRSSKFANAAILIGSGLALAACDKLFVSANSEAGSEAAVAEAPAAAGDFVQPVLEIPPVISWDWTAGTLDGWTFGLLQPEVVHVVEAAGIRIQAPAEPAEPDVYLVSPLLKFEGKLYNRVLVDLEAVTTATKNDLRLFYSTAEHGLTGDYIVSAQNGSPLSAGERRTLVYDFVSGTAVGDDWMSSIVQRIRFDLPQGAGSEYVLHGIRVCSSFDAGCR